VNSNTGVDHEFLGGGSVGLSGGEIALGAVVASLEPGWYVRIPVIDEIVQVPTTVQNARIAVADARTMDGIPVAASLDVFYTISDPAAYVSHMLGNRRRGAAKKWDWLRAETAKTPEVQRSRRCLSQFFRSPGGDESDCVPEMTILASCAETLHRQFLGTYRYDDLAAARGRYQGEVSATLQARLNKHEPPLGLNVTVPEEIQTEATNLETEREKREQARCKVEQTRIPSEATKKAMLDLAEGYARLSEVPGGLMHHTIDTLLPKIIPLLAEPYAQRREERDELRTITETFTSGMKDLTDEFRQQLAGIQEAQEKNFEGLLALVDSLQRLLPPQTKRTLELPSPALRPR
jgi:regulator of protease activity HflC (stomatin/prohibitin superfamily)